MPITNLSIDDFSSFPFMAKLDSGDTIKHDVYSLGEGAPILLIQELPGIGKETFRLAEKLIEDGFKVYLPHLFGKIGSTNIPANTLRVFCMRKEFSLFAANRSSPIVEWLKALCRQIKENEGAQGVGAIGMCLTGNFAIALMADHSVLASVSSQPSMPLGKQTALHMSKAEIAAIKTRIDATAPIMAYRFEGDKFCTNAKFQSLHKAFNSDQADNDRLQLKTLPGNKHSVLTLDFVDEAGHPTHTALQEITRYFHQQLDEH